MELNLSPTLVFALALLPVAALAGWLVARRSARREEVRGRDKRAFNAHYFEGLNYVLNEQPDKAIEVFCRIMEVDSDTLETHFALGNLFRRRGEVDRAIRIHQNLIARPNLPREQRALALLELGQDYMRAGLFDRAENLFNELASEGSYTSKAHENLAAIYEQESEWARAIASVSAVSGSDSTFGSVNIAQYYCELAIADLQTGDSVSADRRIKQALAQDKTCVRASILEGRMFSQLGKHASAVESYKRVLEQDAAFVPEILQPLKQCYGVLDDQRAWRLFLRRAMEVRKDLPVVLAMSDQIRSTEGDAAAFQFLAEQIGELPSLEGIVHYLDLALAEVQASGSSPARRQLGEVRQLLSRLDEVKPKYRCRSCGFAGHTLHWQCPGCKQWSSMRPEPGVMSSGHLY